MTVQFVRGAPKRSFRGAAPGTYSSVADAFVKTARRDGLRAFYNGFGPNFARLGSWCAPRWAPARCVCGPAASVLRPLVLAAHPPHRPSPPPAGTSRCSSCSSSRAGSCGRPSPWSPRGGGRRPRRARCRAPRGAPERAFRRPPNELYGHPCPVISLRCATAELKRPRSLLREPEMN